MDTNIEDLELIKMHEAQEMITARFKEDKNYAFDLAVDSFFLRVKGLNPQRYGLRAQAYFSLLLDYQTIPSSEDCGDFMNKEGEQVEFKCSFISKINKDINVRQIRPWQALKYYYIFTVNYSNYHKLEYKLYKLSKQEMAQECELLNAGSCHGTKEISESNPHKELGFSIKLGSEHFLRWEEKYLRINFNPVQLSEQRLIKVEKEKSMTNLIAEQAARIAELEAKYAAMEANQVVTAPIFLTSFNGMDFINCKPMPAGMPMKVMSNLASMIGTVLRSTVITRRVFAELQLCDLPNYLSGVDYKSLSGQFKKFFNEEELELVNEFILEYPL